MAGLLDEIRKRHRVFDTIRNLHSVREWSRHQLLLDLLTLPPCWRDRPALPIGQFQIQVVLGRLASRFASGSLCTTRRVVPHWKAGRSPGGVDKSQVFQPFFANIVHVKALHINSQVLNAVTVISRILMERGSLRVLCRRGS
ncbi:MAG: hypothetical protein JWM11_700 [Planctomycetaceae bacterium]|nr:hypothetical protein [Planctomycetaceae bacterium]